MSIKNYTPNLTKLRQGLSVLIRNANQADIAEIVEVHRAAFPGFFLTKMGKKFLSELYSAFSNQSFGLLRVALDGDNKIIGFAAGTTEPEQYFTLLRKAKWLSFLLAAIPGIIKHPFVVLRKLYYAMFYGGDKPVQIGQVALLSSIAVLPEMSGKAIGKALLSDFEQQVTSQDVKGLYLTTDKHGNDAVVAFYTKAGYRVESEFTQPDGREMLRLIKSL